MLRRGWVVGCWVALTVAAVSAQIPVTNGARIFFIGNSYIGLCGGLEEYVRRALAAGTPSITVTCTASVSWGKDVDYV